LKRKLEDIGYKVLITHYADLVKYIAKTFFDWNGEKDLEGRSLLQRIGTEDVRTVFPTFWLDFVRDVLTVYHNEWDYVLIPDCRFENEANAFKYHYVKYNSDSSNFEVDFDSIVIRITRTDFENNLTPEQKQHPSETSLDNYNFDYYINTKSGIDQLEIEVDKFIKEKLI
jgi:hypothetical protein